MKPINLQMLGYLRDVELWMLSSSVHSNNLKLTKNQNPASWDYFL